MTPLTYHCFFKISFTFGNIKKTKKSEYEHTTNPSNTQSGVEEVTCIFTEQGSLGLKLSRFTKAQLLKEKRVLPDDDNFRYEAEVCGIQGKRDFFFL